MGKPPRTPRSPHRAVLRRTSCCPRQPPAPAQLTVREVPESPAAVGVASSTVVPGRLFATQAWVELVKFRGVS
jgi:hypothetical protein